MKSTDLSRRKLLNLSLKTSAGLAIAVSSGVVYKAFSEDIFTPIDGAAYQPWLDWNQPKSGPIGLVQSAILAANPHNTQPWRFDIQADHIDIYADLGRNLGSFDPFRREMYLGLGCALENLCLAARHHGYNTEVQYETGALGLDAPATGSILVASVDLSAGEPSTDPLYIEIPYRHTNRFPYLPTELPSTLLESLNRDATNHHVRLDLFNVGDKRSEFDLLMVDSTQWIIQDAEMIHDSHRWFRNNKAEVDEHRDGSTMDAVGLPKPIAAIAKMLPPTEATKAHEMWLTATKEKHLPNAPIVGVISLKNRYDIASTLIAGRYWQRLHLMATSNGVACHPMNQPNEWIDRLAQLGETNIAEQRMARLLGTDQWQSTFSFRMGYATTAAVASPRRVLTDNLI